MLNCFKQKLKKNKFLDAFSRIICYPIFLWAYWASNRQMNRRVNGKSYPQYVWLKGIKDSHKGERCFIVACGPSLTYADLELIKDEYTFGMNSGVLTFDKTGWRPNFYAVQDEYVFNKLQPNINQAMANGDLKEVAVNQIISKRYKTQNKYKTFYLHLLDHKMYHRKGFGKFKYSDNAYACVYDGYSITMSLMQIAVYMGFKEIYLLGCDCNYKQEKTHFVDYGHKDPKFAIMGDKMIQAHHEFKKFADNCGVKVVNCTRGGMLEVYPRMPLERILQDKK